MFSRVILSTIILFVPCILYSSVDVISPALDSLRASAVGVSVHHHRIWGVAPVCRLIMRGGGQSGAWVGALCSLLRIA